MNLWKIRRSGNFSWTQINPYNSVKRPCPATPSEHMAVIRDWSVRTVFDLHSRKAPDFMPWIGDLLVADHVRKILETEGLSRFRFIDADVHRIDKSGSKSLKYWEMVVTGWGGLPNPASGARITEHCPACGWTHFSPITSSAQVLDEATWDGSDCFLLWPVGEFVTDKFKEVVERRKLTGIRFEPIVDYIAWCQRQSDPELRGAGLRNFYTKEEAEKLPGAMAAW